MPVLAQYPAAAADTIRVLVNQTFESLEPRLARSNHDWVPLLFCLQHGDTLLPGGARLAATLTSHSWPTVGWTSLHFAGYHGKPEYAGVALARGAAPDAVTDPVLLETPLHTCARRGDRCVAAARVILAAGAEPAPRNATGRTPLHVAARMPSVGVMRLLLDWGAPPVCVAEVSEMRRGGAEAAGIVGYGAAVSVTPLWDAINRRNLDAARVLVKDAGVLPRDDPSSPSLDEMARIAGPSAEICLRALLDS
jgi:Ankyrin repeats (3 copies)